MNDWPLQRRLLFISLYPLLLVTLILSYYYIRSSVESLRDQTFEQGQLLASQLAPAAEYGVFTGDTDSLNRIIERLLDNKHVTNVSIIDDKKNILSQASKPSQKSNIYAALFDYLFEILSGVGTVNEFSAPITSETGSLDDFDIEFNLEPSRVVIGYAKVKVSLSKTAFKQFKDILSGLMIAIAILISVFLFSVHTSQQITNSIDDLADTVSQIQRGNLSARSHVSSGGELNALQSGVNAMAEKIHDSEENLKKEVSEATSELMKKNLALQEAEREAVAASEAKSVFLANMSHEIRTPMNGIMGFIDVLLKTPLSAQQSNYAETIHNASNNLLLLINDILDFSRIESGKMPVESIPVELNSLIAELFTLHSQNAFNRGIELLFYTEDEIPSKAELDPKLFKQIMINLISNAIKFTEHGHVQVIFRYERSNQRLTVQVKDTGIGIPEDTADVLFNEFEQADNSTARQYGGSGLGLAITNRIVQLLGGKIRAYNHHNGACFEVTLPIKEISPAQQNRSGPHIALIGHNNLAIECYSSIFRRYGYTVFTPQVDNIISSHYQAIIYLISPADIHYRIQGREDAIAFISTNNPEDLKTIQEWGFGHAVHKTINEDEIEDLLHGKDRAGEIAITHPAPQVVPAIDQHNSHQRHQILSGLHVLVIDDNHINLELMDTYLSDLGAEVLMCDNGERAIQVTESNHVDLVFLDIHMPGMDGFETAKTIRERGFTSDMFPIIGLSADGIGSVKEKALASGMDEYMLKPVSQQQLVDVAFLFLKNKIHVIEDNADKLKIPVLDSEAQLRTDLTEMLARDMPNLLADLKECHDNSDMDGLFRTAHKIHGASVYCDMKDIEQASSALEIASRKNEVDAVSHLYEQLVIVSHDFLHKHERDN